MRVTPETAGMLRDAGRDTVKKCITISVLRSWHRLLREAVPSLEVFRAKVDGACSSPIW